MVFSLNLLQFIEHKLGLLSISESEILPFFEALYLLSFKFKESFIARFASHEASMIVNYIHKNLTSIVLKAVSKPFQMILSLNLL